MRPNWLIAPVLTASLIALLAAWVVTMRLQAQESKPKEAEPTRADFVVATDGRDDNRHGGEAVRHARPRRDAVRRLRAAWVENQRPYLSVAAPTS
jgi:hypothetical protein